MNDILERLKLCATSPTDTDLAKKIGVSQQSITSARTKKRVPSSWLITASQLFNVSIDWLYYGTGYMRPSDAAPDLQQAIEQPAVPTKTAGPCPRCERMEAKLEKVELQRDELAQENRQLWKENGELKERCATFEERQKQCCPDQYHPKKANIPSSDPLHIR